MKRYLLLSVFTFVAALTTLLVSNQLSASKATLAKLVLDENIEALTYGEGGTIVCGGREHKGACWRRGYSLKFCHEYSYYECEATGSPQDYCSSPC